jgi:hypothetical protein
MEPTTPTFQTPMSRLICRVSMVKEIQAAIPEMSRAELEQIRDWIDERLENNLELSDEAKAKLDQSRCEIAAGQFTTRQSG